MIPTGVAWNLVDDAGARSSCQIGSGLGKWNEREGLSGSATLA